ncbi:hypothetical protein PR048_021180 [Dryococelus australis]|uniref:Uncharacterized protein n=1 Tax=Dryococelus australis TaxID=614101 RepID=A0ABQ9GXG5_9NEOP|nr:hypothetical protein PR048_021180 [Dryococelus australis]
MRAKRSERGAAPECKIRGDGITARKPADRRHRDGNRKRALAATPSRPLKCQMAALGSSRAITAVGTAGLWKGPSRPASRGLRRLPTLSIARYSASQGAICPDSQAGGLGEVGVPAYQSLARHAPFAATAVLVSTSVIRRVQATVLLKAPSRHGNTTFCAGCQVCKGQAVPRRVAPRLVNLHVIKPEGGRGPEGLSRVPESEIRHLISSGRGCATPAACPAPAVLHAGRSLALTVSSEALLQLEKVVLRKGCPRLMNSPRADASHPGPASGGGESAGPGVKADIGMLPRSDAFQTSHHAPSVSSPRNPAVRIATSRNFQPLEIPHPALYVGPPPADALRHLALSCPGSRRPLRRLSRTGHLVRGLVLDYFQPPQSLGIPYPPPGGRDDFRIVAAPKLPWSRRTRRCTSLSLVLKSRAVPSERAATIAMFIPRQLNTSGRKGRGKRHIPEETRRRTVSSGTIPNYENPATRPGIEPGSPWWEASVRANRSAVVAPMKPSEAALYKDATRTPDRVQEIQAQGTSRTRSSTRRIKQSCWCTQRHV